MQNVGHCCCNFAYPRQFDRVVQADHIIITASFIAQSIHAYLCDWFQLQEGVPGPV